ncbi:unnamed protein product, partial [Coregonus sp. 'balchen']
MQLMTALTSRPALLASAENFTVLIKNNIRFPNFNFIRRNILPEMTDSHLKHCQFNRRTDPWCPIFRLRDIVQEARENFSEMAVENCLPKYSFRWLDEKESNSILYPGLNFRFARYQTEKGVGERTLFKAFGIRFDVMVFGKAGKFSIIQLIIYIGSTLSYYALTTLFIDWLIGTSCFSKEARQNYSEKKVESVQDRQQCILCVSFVDENHIRVVKRSHKKSLQQVKPISVHPFKDDIRHLSAMVGVLQKGNIVDKQPQALPRPSPWCLCGCCLPSTHPQEQLCCRRCITTSSLFEQLVLSRPVLEAVLLYREPLCELTEAEQRTTALRHCAYIQYISWRFGAPLRESLPVMPSCSVWRIREEYSSQDGEYTGLRPSRTTSPQRNILADVNPSYLKQCDFNHTTDLDCPIFSLKDMVAEADEDFQTMAIRYSFRRLDNKNSENNVAPGYNFRFAKYYKTADDHVWENKESDLAASDVHLLQLGYTAIS